MNSFYSGEELEQIGFRSLGNDVRLSRKASIYDAENIEIGNHVRIDDFCILSGRIRLGDHIHISAYSALFAGDYGIMMEDFTTLSSRCAIYALTDDYSGEYMTNPTVPEECRHVTGGQVVIKRHVIIGTGSTILPNLTIGEGTAVGSMSLVRESLDPWGIYVGIPCQRVKERVRKLLSKGAVLGEYAG